jgi:signal transduction histidine kinase
MVIRNQAGRTLTGRSHRGIIEAVTDGSGSIRDERYLVTLGRLTRGALHELANPLLALVGTAEFALADAEPGTKVHDRLATVRSTGLEIAGIVRALQAFTRQRHEPPRRISLAEAAAEAVALVRLVAAAPNVAITSRAEAEPRVHEAPAAVSTALVDLLLDALAGEHGNTIELVVREDGGDAVASSGGAEVRFRLAEAVV